MSNIRTLKDLESGPNKQALPNPWAQQKPQQQQQQQQPYQSGRARTYSNEPFFSDQQGGGGAAPGIQYVALDGYPHTIPAHEFQQKPVASCCLMCCPCFVDPCGTERRQEWVRLFKSFMFVVSVIQVIMFIAELSIDGFASTSDNPMLGPPSSSMVKLGAKIGNLERYQHEVYRFVVPIFLHAGFIHIVFNLWAQLRYGLILERVWGIRKTMIIYFVSGIAGCLFSSLVQPNSISVGASGAIMGLMGGNLAEVLWNPAKYNPQQRKFTMGQLLFIIVLTMVISSAPFIDWSAHLGGVIIGFLLGCFVFTYNNPTSRAPAFVPWLGLGATVVYFILGFALFYTVVHPRH